MGLANSPTSGASADGLLKLEDSVAASGDAGVGILLKRTDAAATQTSATGDYTLPVANLNGAQLIDINRTFQASDPNGLLKAEDAVSASGDAGILNFGVRRDALDTAQTSNVGDYAWHIIDSLGRQIINPFAPSGSYVYGNASATDTTSTSVIAAAGGSLRNYITNLSITNTGATTVLITLQDGSGGTTLWRTIAVAAGGSNITFTIPIRTTANTALFFAAGGSSTTVYVSAAGFTAL